MKKNIYLSLTIGFMVLIAATYAVGQPVAISISSTSNISCNGANDGQMTATVTPGTPNYNYVWSNGSSTNNTASITNTIAGLAPGTYTVTVTDGAITVATASASVSEPPTLAGTIISQANVTCNGGSNGSATAGGSGGSTPYSYIWSSGETTATISSKAAGAYTVSISDANSCGPVVIVANITAPSPVAVSISSQNNVSCNGFSDGTATASGSGGTGGFSYLWSSGETVNLISGKTVGTYTVSVTDASGCGPAITTANITEPPVLTASMGATSNVSCNGGNDGTATVVALGGTAPLVYAWSNGGSTATVTNFTAGTHTVTVTDVNGCGPVTASTTLTEPTALVLSASVTSNVSCNGGSDGGAISSATGAVPPYSYNWSNGASTAAISNVAAGTYTITITDANSCTSSSSLIITEPTIIVASAVVNTNASCNGASDGAATASATGGTGTFTYTWSNGASTAAITGLAAGTYTVSITDANSCGPFTATISITEPAILAASASVNTHVSCNGLSDGSATATPTGGTAPYVYNWSNGTSTATATGLAAGTYTVTVTDANGCGPVTASVVVTEPTVLTALALATSNASCNGASDGSASVLPAGGTPAYAFLWSTGSTNSTATGLVAGTYTVTVTDANLCTASSAVTITEPAILAVSASVTANVSCNGFSDGSATSFGTGGTVPYLYSWSNGASSASAPNLAAGTYTVSITDANGCGPATSSVVVTEPTALSVVISSQNNISCNGGSDGSATASAIGGTSPYTYSWSNGAFTSSVTNFTAGTHTVTVTDANGCGPVTTSVTLTEPTPLVASSVVVANASCNGALDGAASASATGSVPPYTYNWSNGATTAGINSIAAGTYTVTITDANSCTAASSVVISQPAPLVAATFVNAHASCNGFSDGSATASATGGTMPYIFNWSTGASTAAISGLSAGSYTVTVTDINGCGPSMSTVIITEPGILAVNAVINNNVSCNGLSDGMLTASVTGGTAPYIYSWSNGTTTASASGLIVGTYTVTVNDANGCGPVTSSAVITQPPVLTASIIALTNISCNGGSDGTASASGSGGTTPYTYTWSSGETTATIAGKPVGPYVVSVTDANGCGPAISVANIAEPSPVSVLISAQTNVSCNGGSNGSATVSGIGGTAPYLFSWSSGETGASITGKTVGTYTVSITDVNGCGPAISAVSITEPPLLVSTVVPQGNVTCNGGNDGAATVIGIGGTGPLSYNWSNGTTTAVVTNLTAGTHTVSVTDANGCGPVIGTVSITEPTALIATSAINSNVSCNGALDGSVSSSASGSVPPYTFFWSNGTTGSILNNVPAGTYTVTVVDANGCTDTAASTVTEPAVLSISTSLDSNVSCNGFSDGGATGTATGGTQPYVYTWSTGSTNASITNLTAGTYSITVNDANGCGPFTSSISITEPPALSATTLVDSNASCNGFSDGGATVNAIGGTPPYSYNWSSGGSSTSETGLAAGTHTVTTTDANGCATTVVAVISQPAVLVASTSVVNHASCNGFSDGSAIASASGGTSPYAYAWSNGATTATVASLVSGTYSVTVTDVNGCTSTSSVGIMEPALLVVSTIVDNNVSCTGFSDGMATASGSGGTAPYFYNWSNGATTASASGLAAGTYSVSITDANGCGPDVSSVTITEPAPLVAGISIDSNVSCNTFSDGGLSATTSGGTTPYSYMWSDGSSSISATGLTAGSYSVTVTDANGCSDVAGATVTEPMILLSNIVSSNNVSCFLGLDGSTTVAATGGTLPFTYNWSDGQTASTATSLTAGTYTVTVTDANGCADQVSAVINQPTALSATTIVSNVSCNSGSDGAISMTVLGGTPNYTFNWSNGATTQNLVNLVAGSYIVTITDANGCTLTQNASVSEPAPLNLATTFSDVTCNAFGDGAAGANVTGGTMPYSYNWSTGNTTDSITGLVPGTYTVTIIDANNCGPLTASVIISQPTSLVGSIALSTNVSCKGLDDGTATAAASGGVPPYSYTWSSGGAGATETGLTAGIYSVTINDANACNFNVQVTITEPDILTTDVSKTDVTCEGGSNGEALIGVNGGTAPYGYQWDDPANQTTAIATGLVAGEYHIVVTDFNGCGIEDSITLTELFTNPVVDLGPDTIVGCEDSTITLDAGAGFSYQWSTGDTTQTVTITTSMVVDVTITDINGCMGSDTINVELKGPCVGIAEAEGKSLSIRYFPNPTTGKVTIAIDGLWGEQLELTILDQLGRQVRNIQLTGTYNHHQQTFDLSGMPQGFYFTKIVAGNKVYSDRILVH